MKRGRDTSSTLRRLFEDSFSLPFDPRQRRVAADNLLVLADGLEERDRLRLANAIRRVSARSLRLPSLFYWPPEPKSEWDKVSRRMGQLRRQARLALDQIAKSR